jgi:hypothetical protein
VKDNLIGIDVVRVDSCGAQRRQHYYCNCPRVRLGTLTSKSRLPVWRCVWCNAKRGAPTPVEITLLESWIREYGFPYHPLAFCDDGGVRYAYEVYGHCPGPVAWGDVPTTDTQDSASDSAARCMAEDATD